MRLLKVILNMSVTGSIMFFIFLLIKPLTKKSFNSSWHYKTLILILTFLILPVGRFAKIPIKSIPNITTVEIQKPKGLGNIIKNKDIRDTQKVQNIEKQQYEDKTRDERLITTEDESYNPDKNNFNIDSYGYIIQYIWICGMIILFLLKIIPYIKFKIAILQNSLDIQDIKILELFNICKNKLNIKGKVSLKTCENINAPMLVGIFNPTVLIPSTDEDNETLKMIFLHELNHYKQKDIIIKAFGFFANIIHWFNPIVYILLNKMDIYCEYSIDERVVHKMGIEERKYYGETILKLINNSIARKSILTTAMSSNAKELKSRLENMLFFKRTSKIKHMISLVVLLLILTTGFTVGCSVMPIGASSINNPFAVYIKDDGLYYTYLNNGEEIKIHDGDGFEYPLISKSGNYIAYTNKDNLYIYDIKANKYEKVADEIEHYYTSYDWIDDTTIVYATKEPGFAILNVLTKDKVEHLDEYYYTNFKVSNENIIYSIKISKWTTEEGNFSTNNGIVEINLNDYNFKNKTFATNIIVEGRRSTDDMIGYNPIIWDITEDGKYIYIMEKPASGSLSADGISIGIYDVEEKKHTKFEDITTLAYKNHLAINPKDNNLIGLIEGGGREMIENKEVVLLDINENKTYKIINFMDKDLVAMTPNFTLDGEKLLYSATKNLGDISGANFNDPYGLNVYAAWENQPHNIYEYDLKTSKVNKITEGDYFDFMPVSISKDEILFSRYKGDGYYCLVKLANGKENIIADNIIFGYDRGNGAFEFYGHIQTERAVDIFFNKEKVNLKVKENNKKKLNSSNSISTVDGVDEPESINAIIGQSAKFTEEEITRAIDIVKNNFEFPAATLTKIWYDEEKSDFLVTVYLKNGRGSVNGVKPENVIILLSDFDVDGSGDNPVLNPDSTYTDFQWILIRNSKTSDWIIDDCGY